MDKFEEIGKRALLTLAAQRQISITEVEGEIQHCLDEAWRNHLTSTDSALSFVFADGKPSVAGFVGRLSTLLHLDNP